MKVISGVALLKLGESLAALKQFADALDPTRMERAIKAGCAAGDVHLACSYPECKCKTTPNIVKGALAAWEAARAHT